MKALAQHVLYAGLQARQQCADVLHKNMIQGLCQILQTTVRCNAAVLSMGPKKVVFCCMGFSHVSVAHVVLLTAVHHACHMPLYMSCLAVGTQTSTEHKLHASLFRNMARVEA